MNEHKCTIRPERAHDNTVTPHKYERLWTG